MTPELLAELTAPFGDEEIGTRVEITCKPCYLGGCMAHKVRRCAECGKEITEAHDHLRYVGHAYVTARLLEVDPEWDWEPLAVAANGLPQMDENHGLWIRLTIGGTTRLGYGHAGQKRGGDAVKEIIGDAIRNAAMRFGVALELWKRAPATVTAPVSSEAAPAEDTVPVGLVDEPTDPREAAAELRGRILDVSKTQGRNTGKTAHHFTQWSKGNKQFVRANHAELAEYLDHLLQQGKRR